MKMNSKNNSDTMTKTKTKNARKTKTSNRSVVNTMNKKTVRRKTPRKKGGNPYWYPYPPNNQGWYLPNNQDYSQQWYQYGYNLCLGNQTTHVPNEYRPAFLAGCNQARMHNTVNTATEGALFGVGVEIGEAIVTAGLNVIM